MGRTVKDNRPNLKTVTRVELNEEHVGIRIFIVVALIAIAAAAFAYSLYSCSRVESGWTQIKVDSASGASCGDELVFMYELGAGNISATAENKALTLLYTEAAVQAYRIFNADTSFEGVNNVYDLNKHPNEIMEVDEVLYNAFALLESYGNRNIYMSPIYMRYDDMFFCNDDVETVDYDPYVSSDVAAEYQEVANYAGDKEQINIRLLGEKKVCLYVSEEYLEYAAESGITSFIDFFWMKNAFIVDYIADLLTEKGYTHGAISSYDGFSRNMDDRDASVVSYSVNIFDRVGTDVNTAAVIQYSGARSFVNFRDYMIAEQDRWHYYEYTDGETRNSYLDIKDGKCRSAVPDLTSYSGDRGCAEVMLAVSPIYIADTLDGNALLSLGDEGIFFVYCDDFNIFYNDESLFLSEIYEFNGVKYKPNYMSQISQ
ncbi:MAG: hypothetical protein ACI4R6_07325 [Lachnospiraceae bacterium]